MDQPDEVKYDDESTKMLLEQYKLRCQEMLVMVPLNRTHVRNFQIIAGAILGGTALALSRPDSLPTDKNWLLWWAFATFVPVVTTYLMLDILNTFYTMQMVAEAIANIECRLNKILGRELFAWELRISQRFFERRSPIVGKVVNPGWYIGAFGLIIYGVLTVAGPIGACVYILRASPSLRARVLVWVLIAVCFLVVITCSVVVAFISLKLNGMRDIVRAWMHAEIDRDGRDNGKGKAEAKSGAEAMAKA